MNRCGPSSHLVLRVQDSNAQEKSQSRGRVGPTGRKPTPPRALGCVHARAGAVGEAGRQGTLDSHTTEEGFYRWETDASYLRPVLAHRIFAALKEHSAVSAAQIPELATREEKKKKRTSLLAQKPPGRERGPINQVKLPTRPGMRLLFSKLISLAASRTAPKIPSEQNMPLPMGGSMNYKSGI